MIAPMITGFSNFHRLVQENPAVAFMAHPTMAGAARVAPPLLIGKLFGLAGLIIAVPILALVMILTRHILLGEVYGDPVSEAKLTGTVPSKAEPTIKPSLT